MHKTRLEGLSQWIVFSQCFLNTQKLEGVVLGSTASTCKFLTLIELLILMQTFVLYFLLERIPFQMSCPWFVWHSIITKHSDKEFKENFMYELAPYPYPIPRHGIVHRRGYVQRNKIKFYSAFFPLPQNISVGANKFVVVFGGYSYCRRWYGIITTLQGVLLECTSSATPSISLARLLQWSLMDILRIEKRKTQKLPNPRKAHLVLCSATNSFL